MKNFYYCRALFSLGSGALSLFLPLYLYTEHVPLRYVFLFLVLDNIFHVGLTYPAIRLASRFGITKTMMFGICTYALFYFLAKTLPLNTGVILLLGMLDGIADAFYWISYHLYIVNRSSNKTGMQLSYLKNISSIASVSSPAVAGFIIAGWGFTPLFIISVTIMLISVIPLAMDSEQSNPEVCTFKDCFTNKSLFDFFGNSAGFSTAHSVQEIIWPLYLIIVGGVTTTWLGATYSMIAITMLILVHIIGIIVVKHQTAALILGSIGVGIVNLIRGGGTMITSIVSVPLMFASKITIDTLNISSDNVCYQKANADNTSAYIAFREISINGGNAVFWLFAAYVQNFKTLFLVTSITALSCILFIVKKDNIMLSLFPRFYKYKEAK